MSQSLTLGGSMFTHNVDSLDYCYREAIASLCIICDDVVVLDAGSTDGTLDGLTECADLHTNLRVITGAQWDCRPDLKRLSALANEARSHLRTDWHFMLQADEVIHESSFAHILSAVSLNNRPQYGVTRLNLYGDLNHHVSLNAPSTIKPCSDIVLRLAHTGIPAVDDAESLEYSELCGSLLDKITIFHYGFVRRDARLIKKARNMQSWYHGPGSQVDERLKPMIDVFDWRQFVPREHLTPLKLSHPIFSSDWAKARQSEKTIPVPA